MGNEAGSGHFQIERMGLGTHIHGRPSLKQGTGIFCGSGRCLWPENTWPVQRGCQGAGLHMVGSAAGGEACSI